MEWVETTAKSVEEAVQQALEQLGIAREEAEIEVLEEPKSGLFGRVRSEARVRARVQPTKPRAKEERRDRRPKRSEADGAGRGPRTARTEGSDRPSERGDSDNGPRARAEHRGPRPDRSNEPPLDAVPADIETAGREFLEGLVEAMGLSATVTAGVVNSNMIEFQVQGRDLGVLIGPKAQTLQAVQELLRTVVHYETNSSSGRILLDVAGYREKRRVALEGFTRKVAAEVVETGERRALEPMNAADRKVVHDVANSIDGVASNSEGVDPYRYVVLLPR